jgi:hypothetical protein
LVNTTSEIISPLRDIIVRILDASLYFWLPQVNITILRLLQGRNLLHRMVGRTVVIGDIPWVAQAGEAFLSKVSVICYVTDTI